MNAPYAALWINLASDGKSIHMACDNQNNDESGHWRVPYANCIEINGRFYCAALGLRPYINGFELHAKICKLKDIPIQSFGDVEKLFGLSIQIAHSLNGHMLDSVPEDEGIYELYIWDKELKLLSQDVDHQLCTVEPGKYSFLRPSISVSANNFDDEYEYFEHMRRELNATHNCGLRDWPDVRAKFDQWENGDWMYQGITSGEFPDELIDALIPLIQSHLK